MLSWCIAQDCAFHFVHIQFDGTHQFCAVIVSGVRDVMGSKLCDP
jgi:hypothetical protein